VSLVADWCRVSPLWVRAAIAHRLKLFPASPERPAGTRMRITTRLTRPSWSALAGTGPRSRHAIHGRFQTRGSTNCRPVGLASRPGAGGVLGLDRPRASDLLDAKCADPDPEQLVTVIRTRHLPL